MEFLPHFRRALLCGTALVTPATVVAQTIAPNTAPVLDRVVAGGITVSQDAARTQVNQTQQRGIVDWRTFNVGRDHQVQFQQPSSTAITLNRVTTPDPSVIAGRVSANGQIALVNQSGVIFTQGSQVEAAGLVVSTAGITNQNFLAGRMVFDQPGRPDARIENAGRITIREAGLAGFVAPQVANRGTISARMGRVALAAGETHTVDLYGDGLMAIDVTGAVRQAPAGGVALVTNTGVIEAQGGRIQLTAAAADGIVTNLVQAGGRIAADTDPATGRTGTVTFNGTGGAIRIEGEVNARGRAPGTRGGTIEVVADRVLVDRTGRVDASGRRGGGEIALGTTVRGSPNPRLAQRTGIAEGAVVRADATVRGNGGTVIVNSTDYTGHGGTISARGGPQGGNGGFVEVSGQRGLLVLGQIDVGAPAGQVGDILFDPTNLTIVAAEADAPPGSGEATIVGNVLGAGVAPLEAFVLAETIEALTGNVRLEATNDITVAADILKPSGGLRLLAENNVRVNAGRSITISDGAFRIDAGGNIEIGQGATIQASVSVWLSAAVDFSGEGPFPDPSLPGGLTLAGTIAAPLGSVILEAGQAGILQTGGGMSAGTLEIFSGGDVILDRPTNSVVRLGNFDVAGNLTLHNGTSNLEIASGSVFGGASVADTITVRTSGTLTLAFVTNIETPENTGRASLQAGAVVIEQGASVAANVIEIAPFTPTPVRLAVTPEVDPDFPGGGIGSRVSTAPGGQGFELSTDELAQLSPQTLRIGAITLGDELIVTADGITITNPMTVAGMLDLHSLSGITQDTSASLTAGRLTGSSVSSTVLADPFNQITTLGSFSVTEGDLHLQSRVPTMTVANGSLVTARDSIQISVTDGTLRNEGGLVAGGSVIISGTNILENLGSISGGPRADGIVGVYVTGGVRNSGSIEGRGGGDSSWSVEIEAGTTIENSASGRITALGGAPDSYGRIRLVSVRDMTNAGILDGGEILLSGNGNFTNSGTIRATFHAGESIGDGSLVLANFGSTTSSGPSAQIVVEHLQLRMTGDVSILGDNNYVSSLTNSWSDVFGTLTLRSNGDLHILGEVRATSGIDLQATGTITVEPAALFRLAGLVAGGAYTNIRAGADFINYGVAGSSTGDTEIVADGAVRNMSGGLIVGRSRSTYSDGVYLSAGTLIRNDGTIEGTAAGEPGADTLYAAVDMYSDGPIQNAGTIRAFAGTAEYGLISLWATGPISNVAEGAVIIADAIDVSSPGSVTLLGPGNSIGQLRYGYAGGDLALQTSGDLLISSYAEANVLDLRTAGNLTQTGGITANVLRVTATGSAILDLGNGGSGSYPNWVGALGPSDVGENFTLRATCGCDGDLVPMEVQGAIRVGGRLNLQIEGGVQQLPGSVIRATELSVTTPLAIDLLQGDNAVERVVDLSSGRGGIAFRNAQSLEIAGPVSGGFIDGPIRIDVAGGDLTVTAPVQGTDVVRLAASGNLTVTPDASVYVQASQGEDPAIYLQAATTAFGVEPVTGVDRTLPGRLTVEGWVSALGGTIQLGAGEGGIVQSGDAQGLGFSSAPGALSAISGGSVRLLSRANSVNYLDNLDVGGDFLFDNGLTHLLVRGGGSASTFAIRTEGILSIGPSASLVAGAGSGRISLQVGDLTVQPGGRLSAGGVEVAPHNQSGVILGAQHPYSVVYLDLTQADLAGLDTNSLRVGAASFDGSSTTSAEFVSIEGPVQRGSLDLLSLGDISQTTGGQLTVGLLTGSAQSDILLDRASNVVSNLGTFSAGTGDFRLATRLPAGSGVTALQVPTGAIVSANRALQVSVIGGGLIVDGTVRASTTTLQADAGLTVNGFSAIATAGDLLLGGQVVTLDGLASAPAGDIIVRALQSATLGGIAVTPNNLIVNSPSITLGGLDARGAHVQLQLGATGTAAGSLDARALGVHGGSQTTLTGTIGGVGGTEAAVIGYRATAEGVRLPNPPPLAEVHTINGCPIGAGCVIPVPIDPVGPDPFISVQMTPVEFGPVVLMPIIRYPDALIGGLEPTSDPTAAQRVRPPQPEFSFQPLRNRGEENEFAPPDVRRGDF